MGCVNSVTIKTFLDLSDYINIDDKFIICKDNSTNTFTVESIDFINNEVLPTITNFYPDKSPKRYTLVTSEAIIYKISVHGDINTIDAENTVFKVLDSVQFQDLITKLEVISNHFA